MLDGISFIRHSQTSRQTGKGEEVLLCSGLDWGGCELLVGTQTGGLNNETGRGGLDTSRELRQRRTTAGMWSVLRLEVLQAGLGPLGPVAALDPCALAIADEGKVEIERQEEEEAWQEGSEGAFEADEQSWSAEAFTSRQLAARPCHTASLTSSSVVSMTMSRQLPTLRGRNLCEPDSPAIGTTVSLFLITPGGAFWPATEVALGTDVKSEALCGVVTVGLSSLLLLL